jgi:hypothetical protein
MTGQLGSQYASGAGNTLEGVGNARANGSVAQGNIWGGALGSLANVGANAYLYNQLGKQAGA